MYRKVDDFIHEWERARAGTMKVLEAMTDDKLGQKIVEGHNTLGWLGWHLATAQSYFGDLVGITLNVKANPKKAFEIVEIYNKLSQQLADKVKQEFTDASMEENVDMHGSPAPRGAILRTMVDHQTHHRGQMTVLLRQASLPVPGVMG